MDTFSIVILVINIEINNSNGNAGARKDKMFSLNCNAIHLHLISSILLTVSLRDSCSEKCFIIFSYFVSIIQAKCAPFK